MKMSTTDTKIEMNNQAPAQAATPPPSPTGFNKSRRDIARWLLAFSAAFLLASNGNLLSCVFAAGSIMVLKDGTAFSHKNAKWMVLSIITFCGSLMAMILEQGYQRVDEEKAYDLKMKLWFRCKMIKVFWGVTLGFFLVMAATANSRARASAASVEEAKKSEAKKM